jgi:ethanolamine utilization protein EutA (predicted chaperonin)
MEVKDNYKCVNCGTVKQAGEIFYQVKTINYNGQLCFVPTCSEVCANEIKNKNYLLHQYRADDVKTCSIQRMVW